MTLKQLSLLMGDKLQSSFSHITSTDINCCTLMARANNKVYSEFCEYKTGDTNGSQVAVDKLIASIIYDTL